jgi:hypothetical protein
MGREESKLAGITICQMRRGRDLSTAVIYRRSAKAPMSKILLLSMAIRIGPLR